MATITKRGKNYRFRVYAGYNVDGKQIERTKTWTPPPDWSEKKAEKEAQHQAALFEEEIRNGIAASGKIKFASFAEHWMTTYAAAQLKPRTVARYRELLERINAALGHFPLEKIRPHHLLDFYRTLESTTQENGTYVCTTNLKAMLKQRQLTKIAFSELSGVSLTTLSAAYRKTPIAYSSAAKICSNLGMPLSDLFSATAPDKILSPATIQRHHALISKILNDAVLWQYITYNPCERVSPPKAQLPDVQYLDDMQSKHLLELLRPEPGFYRRAIVLDLLTGLRRGELLGLEWSDIDFSQKTMQILRTAQYLPKRGVYTDTTKNQSSKRIVMISDQVVKVLQEQYQWQLLQRHLLGNDWIQSDRVITMPDGAPMQPDRLTHWFAAFVKRTDLPPINVHSLRHTYATLCIAKGVPITAVAEQLGHANVATTAKIYAHAIKSAQIAATTAVGDLLDEYL